MSLLNFYFGRVSYQDTYATSNPQQRSFDFLTKREGVEVSYPVSSSKIIQPGESVLLDSTARTLAANMSTSEFVIGRPSALSDAARLRHTGTGTAPAFRALRTPGHDATSVLAITELSGTAALMTSSSGTVCSFIAGGVVVGDELYIQPTDDSFTSPFNVNSAGKYQIIGVTATSITVRHPGNIVAESVTLGSGFASAFRVFSTSGVKIGDKIKFNASGLNSENRANIVEVLEVTDRDLHFINYQAVPETVVSGTAVPFSIYDRLINFLVVEANGPIGLVFNGGSEVLKLHEHSPGQALFAATVQATSVTAVNSTSSPIAVNLQSCTL